MRWWWQQVQRMLGWFGRTRRDPESTTVVYLLQRLFVSLALLLMVLVFPLVLIVHGLQWIGTFGRAGSGGRKPVYRVQAVTEDPDDPESRAVDFAVWYGGSQHGTHRVLRVPEAKAKQMEVGSRWKINRLEGHVAGDGDWYGRDVELERARDKSADE